MERDLCHAIVEHENQRLTVILKCGHEEALTLPRSFTAEIDQTSVVRFETEPPVGDEPLSGLFATDDPAVILAEGVVEHHIEVDPGHVLIEVSMRRGGGHITVTSEELGGTVPEVGTRLRVWLLGLSVWPVNS